MPKGTRQVSGRTGTYAHHSKASAFMLHTSVGGREGRGNEREKEGKREEGREGERREGREGRKMEGREEGRKERRENSAIGFQTTRASLPEEIWDEQPRGKGGIPARTCRMGE